MSSDKSSTFLRQLAASCCVQQPQPEGLVPVGLDLYSFDERLKEISLSILDPFLHVCRPGRALRIIIPIMHIISLAHIPTTL